MAREAKEVRRYSRAIWVVVGLGALLRVAYVLTVTQHDVDPYDATYYDLQARSIVHGDGLFADPFRLLIDPDDHQPAADHPPLLVLALLPAATIADSETSTLAMRFTSVVFGTATVLAVAALARAVAGDRVALVATILAALDPNLWMNDGLVMPEALATLLCVLVVLGSYRQLGRHPSWLHAAGLGGLVGLATLARAELALLLPFVVLPAMWVGSGRSIGRIIAPAACSAAASMAVLAPWIAFNLARFEEPVLISTSDGLALRAIYCESSFEGPAIGWPTVFQPCAEPASGYEQSVWNRDNRDKALDFLGDNVEALPRVVAARLGRAYQVWRVGQTADFTSREGRPEWAAWSGAVATWLLLPLAVVGAITLRRRGERTWLLLVPIAISLGTIAFLAGGLPRYRATAEPSVVVLSAVAIVAIAERWFSRSGAPAPAEPLPTR